MTEINYVLEGVKIGACFLGIVGAGVWGFYELAKEFKKPKDETHQKERLAYLEAKKERWESYFRKD